MPMLIACVAITIARFFSNYLFLYALSIEEGTHFCGKNCWGELLRKVGIGPNEKYEKRLMEVVFCREDYSFQRSTSISPSFAAYRTNSIVL